MTSIVTRSSTDGATKSISLPKPIGAAYWKRSTRRFPGTECQVSLHSCQGDGRCLRQSMIPLDRLGLWLSGTDLPPSSPNVSVWSVSAIWRCRLTDVYRRPGTPMRDRIRGRLLRWPNINIGHVNPVRGGFPMVPMRLWDRRPFSEVCNNPSNAGGAGLGRLVAPHGQGLKEGSMTLRSHFRSFLDGVRQEGRYRTVIDLERQAARPPYARWRRSSLSWRSNSPIAALSSARL